MTGSSGDRAASPLYRLEWLTLEAGRMGIDRLETAIESIANDDSDAAARTRAVLVDELERKIAAGDPLTERAGHE